MVDEELERGHNELETLTLRLEIDGRPNEPETVGDDGETGSQRPGVG